MADSLHMKLLAVQRAVTALHKDGKNQAQHYDYVSSDAVLGAVREAIDEQGLLLLISVQETHLQYKWEYERADHFTELVLTFTWVNAENPTEREVIPWYGQGVDSHEKGVGKALTYAEKYFLLKQFHIAMDGYDPDADEHPAEKSQQRVAAPKAQRIDEPRPDSVTVTDEVKVLRAWFRTCEYHPDDVKSMMEELNLSGKFTDLTVAGLQKLKAYAEELAQATPPIDPEEVPA